MYREVTPGCCQAFPRPPGRVQCLQETYGAGGRLMHRVIIGLGILAVWPAGFSNAQSQDRLSLILEELFVDNFDNGAKNDWVMLGDNISVVNGRLGASGIFSAYIGDQSWKDYTVEFQIVDMIVFGELRVVV